MVWVVQVRALRTQYVCDAVLTVAEEVPDDEEPRLWDPFESEMDWEVGSWCIKEGVSEGAVNRLLNIRNASDFLTSFMCSRC